MTERWQDHYGTHGYEPKFLGYDLAKPLQPFDAAQAMLVLMEANKPAEKAIAVRELARMRMLTKARAEDAVDLQFMAAAYADEMRIYPADVIASACRKWTAMEKWWPSWAELKDLLEFRMRKRRAMLKALEEAR